MMIHHALYLPWHIAGGARRELGCTAASRFIFDVDRVSKKQHRAKICGIPPRAPTDAIFLVANFIGASGEAIGAFSHFARVFSSVAQSK
jgi:hypothetical protein